MENLTWQTICCIFPETT